MTATATINIGGKVEDAPTGGKTFQGLITSTNAVNVTLNVTLDEGDNSFDVPTGAVACLIQPPANNTAILTLKGGGEDQGTGMHPTFPYLKTFRSDETTFIINANSATASPTELSFI